MSTRFEKCDGVTDCVSDVGTTPQLPGGRISVAGMSSRLSRPAYKMEHAVPCLKFSRARNEQQYKH